MYVNKIDINKIREFIDKSEFKIVKSKLSNSDDMNNYWTLSLQSNNTMPGSILQAYIRCGKYVLPKPDDVYTTLYLLYHWNLMNTNIEEINNICNDKAITYNISNIVSLAKIAESLFGKAQIESVYSELV